MYVILDLLPSCNPQMFLLNDSIIYLLFLQIKLPETISIVTGDNCKGVTGFSVTTKV